jgi:hypothetical protein
MNSSMVQQPVRVGVAERFSLKNNKTSKYTVGANHDSPAKNIGQSYHNICGSKFITLSEANLITQNKKDRTRRCGPQRLNQYLIVVFKLSLKHVKNKLGGITAGVTGNGSVLI